MQFACYGLQYKNTKIYQLSSLSSTMFLYLRIEKKYISIKWFDKTFAGAAMGTSQPSEG